MDEHPYCGRAEQASRVCVRVAFCIGVSQGVGFAKNQRLSSTLAFNNMECLWYPRARGVRIGFRVKFHALGENVEWLQCLNNIDQEICYDREGLELVSDKIESLIKGLLPGIQFTNTYCICSMCNKARVCTQIDKNWLCEACAIEREKAMKPMIARSFSYQERLKLTPKKRFAILKRDNFTCQICGRSPTKGDDVKLHVTISSLSVISGSQKTAIFKPYAKNAIEARVSSMMNQKHKQL